MLSFQLDDSGGIAEKHAVDPFFDPDEDPVFDKPAYTEDTAYFVSYLGKVYPVRVDGAEPAPLESWSFVNKERSI